MYDPQFFEDNSNLRIKRNSSEIEPQEVLLDKLSRKQSDEHEEIEVPLSHFMFKGLYVLFFALVVLFIGKTIFLQSVSGDELSDMAQNNTVRNISILAERGVIYDSSFEQLVFNEPSFDFVCDKRDLPQDRYEREDVLLNLANISGLPHEDLKERFDASSSVKILIAENMSHEELILFDTKKESLPACRVQENTIREYSQGSMFSHLLGYTAKISQKELESVEQEYSVFDQIGKIGVESFYESVLRGVNGKILQDRDSFGKIVGDEGVVEPVYGDSLVLHLSAGLQNQIVSSFQEVFDRTGTRKATAVALDPRNGGILAMVSLPTFDSNDFSGGISQSAWDKIQQDVAAPLFNRSMAGIGYPTGSVIKPIVALAALEEGIIESNTNIFAPEKICIRNPYTELDECFHDWEYHGNSDVRRAIAESVNTFFYIIGGGYKGFEGLGPYKIKEYLEKFNWNRKTNVDLPGEGKGILPTLDNDWRLGDTYHFSIGQGPFAVTPLQVAAAFVGIANGGTLYEPRAVDRIIDIEKETIKKIESVIISDEFVGSEYIEDIREGMRQTVTNGSATGWLDGLPVKAAVKTGTAQTGKKTWDGKDFLYSWTVAFAPYDNPEIVLVVLTEDIIEGQVGTLPVARDVFQWYFNQ